MPQTRSTQNARERDAANKRRRMALARRRASWQQCGVPGCPDQALIDEEDEITDCCYVHSLHGSDTDSTLTNDGYIDWTAVEVASKGLRPVRLTWVEKDIVMAIILANGGNITTALDRAGVHHQCANSGRRAQAVARIVEALRA